MDGFKNEMASVAKHKAMALESPIKSAPRQAQGRIVNIGDAPKR